MSVAIAMGSDSDESVMRVAADGLDEFGITWEMRVLPAHQAGVWRIVDVDRRLPSRSKAVTQPSQSPRRDGLAVVHSRLGH
jgi:hypothetical protein